MDELYNEIKEAIRAINIGTEETPRYIWVDQDEGQLENYFSTSENPENKPPLSYPAALINVEDISYLPISGKRRRAQNDFTIKLAFKVYEGAHSNVPNDNYFRQYPVIMEVIRTIESLRNCRLLNSIKATQRIAPLVHTLRFRINYAA